MAAQPSEGDINTLVTLGIARDEAIARLKGNNNNPDQAANEYFEDPDGSRMKYRWDESQFHTDRDGGIPNSHGVAFEVQGPDEFPPNSSGRYDGSISRPPSRINNKSPLGKVIDLTANEATGGAQNPMYFDHDQGDSALQQALAQSRVEAGLPPQQSGTTNTEQDRVHFGPATKEQYEEKNWGLVTTGKVSTQEILVDPEPIDRKRDLDVPAFLRPSVEDNRVGALITMLHAIPQIRELFLDREVTLTDYGRNNEWWNGQSVKLTHLIGIPDGEDYEGEVIFELQRLMAFLDKTDRSYGSADALSNMRDVEIAFRTQSTREAAVLEAWRRLSEQKPWRVNQLFSRGVQSEAEQNESHDFVILDLPLPVKDSPNEDIYDMADEALWAGLGADDVSQNAYLAHVAPVIAIRTTLDNLNYKKINVPAVWYPDRYLFEHRQAAFDMRMSKKKVLRDIERIETIQERLTIFPSRNGKLVNIKDLFAASLRHDEKAITRSKEDPEPSDLETSFAGGARTAALSAKLERAVASIDKKLAALNEEKEKAVSQLRELSQLYTKESDDTEAPKLTKYLLRGVSAKKEVTYICRRAEPDLIEIDLDSETPKELGDQWWKLAYVVESFTSKVVVEKTTEEEVLKVASEAGPHVLLIYAQESAIELPIKPAPRVLENFVKYDNKAFQRELPSASEDTQTQVSSPGKRKFDDSDSSSPIARESDREYRLNGSPQMGWADAATASSRKFNAKLDGVEEDSDVVIGIDPQLLNNEHENPKSQEMQEKGGVSLLNQVRSREEEDNTSLSTIDNMELDEVIEDAAKVEPSPAVKHVEFKN